MRKFSLQEDGETFKRLGLRESRRAYKNIFGICTSLVLTFGAFVGIASLQSSINDENGLGYWTVFALYLLSTFTVIVGQALVKLVGSKYTLSLGFAVYLVYSVLNYHPHWGTLMAGSILVGLVGYGAMWTAALTHATATAIKFAPALKEEPQHLVAFFSGAVGLSVKLSQIFGNGISAITLWNLHANTSNYTSSVCDNDSASKVEANYIYYVLISLYVMCCIMSVILTMATVDHYGIESKFLSARQMFTVYLLQPIKETIKLSVNWKILCLSPLGFACGFTLGLPLGVYSKVYISDCVGVQWIGVVLAVYGVTGGIAAISAGRLVKYIPQCVILYPAFAVCIGLSLFLIFWERIPNYYVMFGVAVGWSLVDGVINALVPGMYGYMFQEQKEIALGLWLIMYSIGFAVTFIKLSPEVELIISVSMATLAIITYTILLLITSSWIQKLLDYRKNQNEVKRKQVQNKRVVAVTNQINDVY